MNFESTEHTARPRAGRYLRQSTGYRAFMPASLPPDPPIRIEGDFQRLLSQADRALGRLDGSIQTLPNPDLFVFMYVRKEAVLSSQIEGTQSSLQDLLAAEANILTPEQPRDVNEVVNYVRAMNYGLNRLRALPLSGRLIREPVTSTSPSSAAGPSCPASSSGCCCARREPAMLPRPRHKPAPIAASRITLLSRFVSSTIESSL